MQKHEEDGEMAQANYGQVQNQILAAEVRKKSNISKVDESNRQTTGVGTLRGPDTRGGNAE